MIYFDDLKVGDPIVIGTYMPSKDEAIAFAMRWEPQPHHVDERAAEASVFGGLTLCSLYLFAIVTRLFFDYERPFAVTAMLGKDEIRFPRPARPGDELRYQTECVDKRVSKSRPDRGIVTLHDVLTDTNGETVLTQTVTLLMEMRPT
jgi:acyl dehydratase